MYKELNPKQYGLRSYVNVKVDNNLHWSHKKLQRDQFHVVHRRLHKDWIALRLCLAFFFSLIFNHTSPNKIILHANLKFSLLYNHILQWKSLLTKFIPQKSLSRLNMKKKSTSNNYTIQFFSMCSKEGIKGYYNGNWQDQLT